MIWINIENQLPEEKLNVFLYMHNKTHSWVQIGMYDDYYPEWFVCDACMDHVEIDTDEVVTHWHPLPHIPKELKQ